MSLSHAVLVPGLPHVLQTKLNPGYQQLATATAELGDQLYAAGVRRLLYYSTQWISVLGHLYQTKTQLQGLHVDENWHDLADLPFDFRIDSACAGRLATAATAAGYQTKLVDYAGFPVDTGTIVADRLLNKNRFNTVMLSCCVYSDYADTVRLVQTAAQALADDGVPTAAVAVSTLSGRYFTTEIDLREDHVSTQGDDAWNQRFLELLKGGRLAAAEALLPEYAAATKLDMGGKALAFLRGTGVWREGRPAEVLAYGGLYGTGAVVMR